MPSYLQMTAGLVRTSMGTQPLRPSFASQGGSINLKYSSAACSVMYTMT